MKFSFSILNILVLVVIGLSVTCLIALNYAVKNYQSAVIINEGIKPVAKPILFSKDELALIKSKFNFSDAENVPDDFSGLKPRIPIAMGYTRSVDSEFSKYGYSVQYVVLLNGQCQVVRTRDEFSRIFAPIETEEEALSYAVAMTPAFTMYKFDLSQCNIYTDTLRTSRAKRFKNGYKVFLFYTIAHLGMCYFPTFSINCFVSKNGEVKILKAEKVFENSCISFVD